MAYLCKRFLYFGKTLSKDGVLFRTSHNLSWAIPAITGDHCILIVDSAFNAKYSNTWNSLAKIYSFNRMVPFQDRSSQLALQIIRVEETHHKFFLNAKKWVFDPILDNYSVIDTFSIN